MPETPLATTIYVPGRGCNINPDGSFTLSVSSLERAKTAANYFEEHRPLFETEKGLIVCSGGWSGLSGDLTEPPAEYREGHLMANVLRQEHVPEAFIFEEVVSDSTLESCIECQQAKLFTNINETHPLGIVTQKAHAARIKYFANKVFHLRSSQLQIIEAPGEEELAMRVTEALFYIGTLVMYGRAESTKELRRAEKRVENIARALHLKPAKLYANHASLPKPTSKAYTK